jgi:hypothetical protein
MRVRTLVSAVVLSLAVAAGPAFAVENVDKVFGGITAEAGKEYGSLQTVNGGITIRDGATVRSAETVNGGISMDDDATAESLEAVNGGLNLGERAKVATDVETVNGGIKLADGAGVGGDLETVNGGITLTHAEVGGDVTTTNGDVMVVRSSVIRGALTVKKPESQWWNVGDSKTPRVVIGAGSVVHGPMVFERDVELLVHTTAKTGTITGATAIPFTDELPPRKH